MAWKPAPEVDLFKILWRNSMKVKFPFRTRWISLVLAVGFVAGVGFVTLLGSGNNIPLHQTSAGNSVPQPTAQGRQMLEQFSAAFESAAAQVNASVVPIYSEQVKVVQNPFGTSDPFRQFFGDDFFHQFFGNQPQQQKEVIHALGSGVIVSKDGYILTNNHVVKGAQKLTVMLSDKKKYKAKVIGTDPQTDVAVVKIDANDLPVATLGNSSDVKVGEWVIAVGNPFELMHTVTAGIISAKGRSTVGLADYSDFIQTDASINPGNSGGALADLDGNVIGINTAIYSPSGGNVGIGFAIPINMAKEVMNQLIKHGKVTRGFLGIDIQDVNESVAKAMKLNTAEGALVGDVNKDSPAEKAGIKVGDVITAVNGQKVESSDELRNTIAGIEPGTTVKITLNRKGDEKTVEVTLGERPSDEQLVQGENGGEQESTSKKLGITLENLNAAMARQLGIQSTDGVVVTDVDQGSPADDAGVKKGDVVEQVNQVNVKNVSEFRNALGTLKSGESVALLLKRDTTTFFVGIDIP